MKPNNNLSEIDINKSFLDQKPFQNLLKIDSLKVGEKLNALDLLKIIEVIKYLAKNHIDMKQLVDSGDAEVEITGIELEYVLSGNKESFKEKYYLQWHKQDEQEKDDKAEIDAHEESSYLQLEFLQKLSHRLDELSELTEDGRITSFKILFSMTQKKASLPINSLALLDDLGETINSVRNFLFSGCVIKPDYYEGTLYKRWFCNGDASDWVLDAFGNKKPWRRG
ncbi:hypothetical protein [Anabaena lutea]|uniref:Uncharacterized protein n=1 Tax=Anabaena lutea FACHB-196 TaxID=2692881 RepID=A0ABR8FDL8_9NOST|nr:hypothetical protein [Anabaena lutea]MBD2566756.1 hypothetical protein [Anabaena lutea FACHB-196]